MAELISGDRIIPVWLEAARTLNRSQGRTALNVVLEIASPTRIGGDDLQILRAVDAQLMAHTCDMSLDTVAGTLFPNHLYKRFGRPDFYDRYLTAIKRGKKKNSWGTYAWRMMERLDRRSEKNFNPLDRIVQKFIDAKKGQGYKAVYELGVIEPDDLLEDGDNGPWCELPVAAPAAKSRRNIPCLSHLSFKLHKGQVALTAVYRAHHYAQRALGNLIGLSQLQGFVATEAGLDVGPLTCISTLAVLDVETWGGAGAATTFLSALP